MKENKLTEGNIFSSLIKFACPVFLALLLQALYGGVDLLIVGRFAQNADVSGVATGSALMMTVTGVIMGISMGITVLVGRRTGEKNFEAAADAVGAGICLFAVIAAVFTVGLTVFAKPLAVIMKAPPEALSQTSGYIAICGAGSAFIVAYNVFGSVFRGMGDSKTPLMTVAIACAVNILGDLLCVAVLNLGAAGAAIATAAAQGVSVAVSLAIIKRKKLPFRLTKKNIRPKGEVIREELRLGTPIALQDLLVGISFLVIQVIVNDMGIIASASVGIADKICMFLMLIPDAFMQAMSAFVAQNLGAEKPERARASLRCGIITSLIIGAVMAYVAIAHGDLLTQMFTSDKSVVAAAHKYLMAYGIDCLLTAVLFCFIGYYNGSGKTLFVMLQGVIGAMLVRVPAVFILSRLPNTTLFLIGLATPMSSVVQIILCVSMFGYLNKKD